MPSKKQSTSRLIARRKGVSFKKKAAEPLPDTSRIPWISTRVKTGREK
jgi:hypothetical protein